MQEYLAHSLYSYLIQKLKPLEKLRPLTSNKFFPNNATFILFIEDLISLLENAA